MDVGAADLEPRPGDPAASHAELMCVCVSKVDEDGEENLFAST
jgi:hypothetical protein